MMTCNGCGAKFERKGRWIAAYSAEAIALGWQLWFSESDGLGDRRLREGEVRCPLHRVPDAEPTPCSFDDCKNFGQFDGRCYFHRAPPDGQDVGKVGP